MGNTPRRLRIVVSLQPQYEASKALAPILCGAYQQLTHVQHTGESVPVLRISGARLAHGWRPEGARLAPGCFFRTQVCAIQ